MVDRDLTAQLYGELRALAAAHLRHERPGHTLQATALANEAYLRMDKQRGLDRYDRAQFLALASRMVRRVLVDHARARNRAKRGGGRGSVTLHSELAVAEGPDVDLLALHDALEKLTALDARQGQVVELRFFGGLTVEECASIVGVGKRTIDNDWSAARAWLRRELS